MGPNDVALLCTVVCSIFGWGLYFGIILSKVPRVYGQSLRESTRSFLASSNAAISLEIIDSMCSMIASTTYVLDTYSTIHNGWGMGLFCMDTSMTLFFSFNFLLQFYVSRNRCRYLYSAEAIIDGVTIVPMFIVMAMQIYPSNSYTSFFRVARLLKVAKVFRLFRMLKAAKTAAEANKVEDALVSQLIDTCAKFICLVFISSGLTQALDQYEADLNDGEGQWAGNGEALKFHDALYFVIITLSTVGYGDISPSDEIGRLFICVAVFTFIFFLPTESNRIGTIMSLRSQYSGKLKRVYRGRQILIACNPNCYCEVENLLLELFHEDHGLRGEHAVILCPCEPDLQWGSLLLQYASQDKITFLRGDAQAVADLRRAHVKSALAAFVLSDRHAADTQLDDTTTLLRVLTVLDAQPRLKIFAQVIHKRSRERVLSLGLQPRNVICTGELKMMMLASACQWHGWPLMVSNLLSSTPVDIEVGDNSHAPPPGGPEVWAEYVDGLGKEVYKVSPMGQLYRGQPFPKVAKALFAEHQAVLFAVSRGGQVLLNPGRGFIFQAQDRGFLLADDSHVVVDICRSGGTSGLAANPVSPRNSFASAVWNSLEKAPRPPALKPNGMVGLRSNGPTPGLPQEGSAPSSAALELPDVRLANAAAAVGGASWKRKSLTMSSKLLNASATQQRMARQTSAAARDRALLGKGAAPLAPGVARGGHVVLATRDLGPDVAHFIGQVRAQSAVYSGRPAFVAVLCPKAAVDRALAADTAYFFANTDEVLLIEEEVTEQSLAMANARNASVIVITRDTLDAQGEGTGDAASSQVLAALVELLAFAGPRARFVLELNGSRFLKQVSILETRVAQLEEQRALAAGDLTYMDQSDANTGMNGDVVLSNFSEQLLAQTYFNDNIVDVVSAMLSSTDFGGMTTSVCQVELPSQFAQGGPDSTFGALLMHMIDEYDAVPVGLLRKCPEATGGNMLVTSPSGGFLLQPDDTIFCFASTEILDNPLPPPDKVLPEHIVEQHSPGPESAAVEKKKIFFKTMAARQGGGGASEEKDVLKTVAALEARQSRIEEAVASLGQELTSSMQAVAASVASFQKQLTSSSS